MIIIDNKRAADIRMRAWDDEASQYGQDFAADFFAGESTNYVDTVEYGRVVKCDDIEYCLDYARDYVNGSGDFAEYGPQNDIMVEFSTIDYPRE